MLKWNGDTKLSRSRMSLMVVVAITIAVVVAVFFIFRPQQEIVIQPLPQVSLTVEPDIIQQGGTATLRWETTDATSVNISGIGDVSISGTTVVSVKETTEYTITAVGAGGVTEQKVTLNVIQPSPTIAVEVNPRIIGKGDETTIRWETTGATVVNISGIDVSISGSKTVSPPSGTTEYTVRATGAGGIAEQKIEVIVLQVPTYKGKIVEGYSTMSLLTFKDDENKERYRVTFQGDAKIIAPFDGEVSVIFRSISVGNGLYEIFPGISVTFYDHNRVTLAKMTVYGDGITIVAGLEPYFVGGSTKNRTVQKGRVIATSSENSKFVLCFTRLDWVNDAWLWSFDHNMFLYYFPTLFDGK